MSLNENHRQSIVALAEKSPYVSYADLHVVLGTQNDLELEKLIVEAIYEGTITGKLDPSKQMLEIMDWKASVPSAQQCEFIKDVLGQWVNHCEALIGDLGKAAGNSNEYAKTIQEENEAHEKKVEKQREELKAMGKGAEPESSAGRLFPMSSRDMKRMTKGGPTTSSRSRRNQ